jgi:hypothetical protein
MEISRPLVRVLCLGAFGLVPVRADESRLVARPRSVIVRSRFGGQISGFDIQRHVSFLTYNAEIKTIAVILAPYSTLPDRMTGWSAVASSKTRLRSTRRFLI